MRYEFQVAGVVCDRYLLLDSAAHVSSLSQCINTLDFRGKRKGRRERCLGARVVSAMTSVLNFAAVLNRITYC